MTGVSRVRTKTRTFESVRFDKGEMIPRAARGRRGKAKYASDAWLLTRKNHLAVYPECRVCDLVDPSNHVHHLRYRGVRGESEKPGDLVTLCSKHHNELHATLDGGSLVKHTIEFIRQRRPLSDPGRAPRKG